MKKQHKRSRISRSFVAATFAMTVDGKITTKNFSPVDFTSREDKMHLFRQRALADAVLIGHTSLKRDNVRLGLPVALVAITGTLIALRYDFLSQTTETRQLLWFLLFLLGSSILFLLSTFVISGFNLFHWLPEKFPGREKLIEISAAYHLYAHHWRATLVAFGVSIVAHLATFATFLCAAYALGAAVPLLDFFAVMPVERTISALPISFAGIGLREKILQIMLNGLCGVPEAKAILIGSLSFLIILVCCIPGAVVYLFYKPSGAVAHVRLREMEKEVATLEHEISETE